MAFKRVWVVENNESLALESTVTVCLQEKDGSHSLVDIRGEVNAVEGKGPLFKFPLMGIPGVRLQAHDTMFVTVVQELFCNIVSLVHSFGPIQPTAVLIPDGELGFDDGGFFEHELLNC